MGLYSKTLCTLLVLVALKAPAQFSRLPQNTSTHSFVYRLKEISDSVSNVYYHHSFVYDKWGRPLYHRWDYRKDGKAVSSSVLKYSYGADGKLVSKNSNRSRYSYFYDQKGTLVRITLHLIISGQWMLCEETFLEEKDHPSGEGKLVHYRMDKTKRVDGKIGPLATYCTIDYSLDSSNNVRKAKVYSYGFKTHEQPKEYSFHYDSRPNPVQNIFLERWYQLDMENGGLTNVAYKEVGGRVTDRRVYEYNQYGYPSKCTIGKSRTKTFRYELVGVRQEKPVEVLAPSEVKRPMLLYPNPASTQFVVKADSLGKGMAVLRVYDFSGRSIRQVSYQVDQRLEALLPTNGMPAGTYVVEIVSPKGVVRRKLIVR